MQITIIGHLGIGQNKRINTSYHTACSPPMFISRMLYNCSDVHLTIISHHGRNYCKYINKYNVYPKNPRYKNNLLYKITYSLNGKCDKKAFYRRNSPPVIITQEIKKIIKNTQILFITPLLPNFSKKYIKNIISHTRGDCLKVLLPQGFFRSFNKNNEVFYRKSNSLEHIISFFDVIISSIEDSPHMEKYALHWARMNNKKVIITRAEKGATYYSKYRTTHIPTVPVQQEEIIDATGSGDIFSACSMYYYHKIDSIINSIKKAHCIARYFLFLTPHDIDERYNTIDIDKIEYDAKQNFK